MWFLLWVWLEPNTLFIYIYIIDATSIGTWLYGRLIIHEWKNSLMKFNEIALKTIWLNRQAKPEKRKTCLKSNFSEQLKTIRSHLETSLYQLEFENIAAVSNVTALILDVDFPQITMHLFLSLSKSFEKMW